MYPTTDISYVDVDPSRPLRFDISLFSGKTIGLMTDTLTTCEMWVNALHKKGIEVSNEKCVDISHLKYHIM